MSLSIISVVRNNPLVAQALASVLGQKSVRGESVGGKEICCNRT
jgi:hypothetical protein